MVEQDHSVDASFRQAFGVDYASFDKIISKYLKKQKFQFQKIKNNDPYTKDKIEVNLLSSGSISFYFGELLRVIGFKGNQEAIIAISLFEKSLQSDGLESGKAMLHMFRIQLEQNDIDEADSILDRMKAQVSDYPGTYKAQGDLDAIKMFELSKIRDPEWRNYFDCARAYYRIAISIDNNFIPGYMGMAIIYANNIDSDLNLREGINAFCKLTYFPNFPNFDYQYAVLLLRYRRPGEARDRLSRVIAGADDEKLANKARKLRHEIYIDNSEKP